MIGKKYCMRLLLLAILSELPINLMYSGLLFYPFHQNVIWTLLTGFLCIWAIDTLRKKCPVWLWIPSILLLSAVGYVLATLLMFDYYGEGVLTVIVFYLFHGKKWWQLAGQFAGLYWINVMLLAGNADSITAFRSCLRDFRTGTGAVVSAASVVLPWTPGRA
ncbi:MAG: TraX family protein [Waltera sp.]